MLTIDALRAWGANVDEGLTRCCGNEAFYLRLAGMAAQDGNFARLEEALVAEDYSAAFEAAHALKGVLANLALTPWLAPVSEMTELLRGRQKADCAALLSEAQRQRDAFVALCKG